MNAPAQRRDQVAPSLLLGALALVTLLPLISLVVTALQPQGTVPAGLTFPTDPHWGNFAEAWDQSAFLHLVGSTGLIVLGVVPAAVLISTMAGYGLAQMRLPGGVLVFGLFIFGLTLPFEAILTPLYVQMRSLGLLNTRLAIILPLLGLYMPFSVFWMRSHFASVPVELSEAAQIDGASPFMAFRRIHVPLALPAWASLAMLLSLWTSNQFLLAIVLVSDPTKRTLAGAIGAFQGQRVTNMVLVCAVTVLIIAPATIVFLVLQRHFVKALLQGVSK